MVYLKTAGGGGTGGAAAAEYLFRTLPLPPLAVPGAAAGVSVMGVAEGGCAAA